THHLNFAQGEMGMFSTYVAWAMINADVPYWLAFVSTLALSFGLGLVLERTIIRPMQPAPILSVVTGSLALAAACTSLAGFLFGTTIKSFPSPFPVEAWQNDYVGPHQLGVLLVTLFVVLVLYVFFRFTPLGLAMRAVASNQTSSRLVGIRVGWMLALGW